MKKNFNNYIEDMQKINVEISSKLNSMLNNTPDINGINARKNMDYLHSLIMKLYSALVVYNRHSNDYFSNPDAFSSIPSGNIKVTIESPSKITIKMPRLYHKGSDDKLLINDLNSAFKAIILGGEDIPQMKNKTLRFTHIYSTNTKNQFIRDNDNYVTKGIINTIVKYIGSTDRGDSCWMEYRTVLTDEEEEGTLIEVLKR